MEQLQKRLKVRHVESLSTSSRSLNSSTQCLAVASKTSTNAGTFLADDSDSNKNNVIRFVVQVRLFQGENPLKVVTSVILTTGR